MNGTLYIIIITVITVHKNGFISKLLEVTYSSYLTKSYDTLIICINMLFILYEFNHLTILIDKKKKNQFLLTFSEAYFKNKI